MYWNERLQVALAAFGDAGTSFWDLIHSPNNENDDFLGTVLGDLGTLSHVPIGIGAGVFNLGAAAVSGAAQGYENYVQPVADKISQLATTPQVALNLQNSPTWRLNRAQHGDTGPFFASLLDPATWSKAWDLAQTTSYGQALNFNGLGPAGLIAPIAYSPEGGTDILDPKAVQQQKDSVLFNVTSGLSDAAFSWYTDPVAGPLKVLGTAKKVKNVYQAGAGEFDPWLDRLLHKTFKLGEQQTDPYLLANSDKVDKFLVWASGRSPREIISHPLIKKMSKRDDAAGVLAGLLGWQDVSTARKVIAVGYGSKKAAEELAQQGGDIALRLKSVEGVVNNELDFALAQKQIAGAWIPQTTGGVANNLTGPGHTLGLYIANKQQQARDALVAGARQSTNPHVQEWLKNPQAVSMDSNILKNMMAKDDKELEYINAAIGKHKEDAGLLYDMTLQVPRKGMESKADRLAAYDSGSFSQWEESLDLPKAFGVPFRVVSWPSFKLAHEFTDKRPPSWIDPNRRDSATALNAYMKSSKIFDEKTRNHLLNRYIEAINVQEKRGIVQDIEHEAITRLGMKYGVPVENAQMIARESSGQRNAIIQRLNDNSGKLYGVYDNNGIPTRVEKTSFETQSPNSFPILKRLKYKKAFIRHSPLLRPMGSPGQLSSPKKYLSDSFEVFNSLWSTTNLLRPGYTIRNVTDDTLRTIASLGAMAIVGHIGSAVQAGLTKNAIARAKNIQARTVTGARHLRAGAGKVALPPGALVQKQTWKTGQFGLPMEELRDYVAETVDKQARDLGSVQTQSNLGWLYRGMQFLSPYTGRGEIYHRLVGSTYDNIAQTTRYLTGSLREHAKLWDVVKPDDPRYMQALMDAIHNQIGKSELGKKFLEGRSGQDVADWLTSSREGRALLKDLGKGVDDAEHVAGQAQSIVDYLVPLIRGHANPFVLRDAAARGEVTPELIEKLMPNPLTRPQVHAPTVDLNLSQGNIHDALTWVINKGFRWFGEMPTDKLVRHPTFNTMYRGNVQRMYDNLASQGIKNITSEDLRKIEAASREISLKQLNNLLYDGSTKSNIAHRLRFLTGFFSAWEDSITKWAKIAVDKPQVMVNGMRLWNAPNDMSLGNTYDPVTQKMVPRFQALMHKKDAKGNPTNEWVKAPKNWDPFEMNEEVFLQARLPEWFAKYVPGASDQGDIKIAKSSLNLVLQGNPWWLPGAGPITNIALSQYMAAYPTKMTDVYNWALPYGGKPGWESAVKSLAPAWVRRQWEANESVTDQSKAVAMLHIAQVEDMRAKLGHRNRPHDAAFWKEIEDRTEKFYNLRTFINLLSPASIQFESPYQFYIDKAREMQEKDPENWEEKFITNYGEDYYMFATSMSKNVTGLGASKEAWDKSQKVKDLIANDPEMAQVYVGQIANPTFDQYVYQAQFSQELGATGKTSRMHQTPDEAIKENQRRLGWVKYTQMMDRVDAMQFEQDPEFVEAFRTEQVKKLAQENDVWARDYFENDPERVPRNIDKLQRLITDNPKMLVRPDIKTLSLYLTKRDEMLSLLDSRYAAGGSRDLMAKSNQDLALLWKGFQDDTKESNTLFGRLFWRFLSNDHLQRSVLDK